MRRRIAATTLDAVERLSDAERAAMFELFARYYDGVERDTFHADLAGKQHVIRMFDAERQLVGFSTIQLMWTTLSGRRVLTIFSGDTVIDRACWGQKALQRRFSRYLFATVLRHPATPVYWFLISKGYKTYLLIRNNFPNMVPNRERPTPREAKQVLDHVAQLKYPETYQAARGVIHSCGQSVSAEVAATLTERDLAHPDIAFFCEQNPGWAKGDELCCLAPLRIRDMVWIALKYFFVLPIQKLRPRPRSAPPTSSEPASPLASEDDPQRDAA